MTSKNPSQSLSSNINTEAVSTTGNGNHMLQGYVCDLRLRAEPSSSLLCPGSELSVQNIRCAELIHDTPTWSSKRVPSFIFIHSYSRRTRVTAIVCLVSNTVTRFTCNYRTHYLTHHTHYLPLLPPRNYYLHETKYPRHLIESYTPSLPLQPTCLIPPSSPVEALPHPARPLAISLHNSPLFRPGTLR